MKVMKKLFICFISAMCVISVYAASKTGTGSLRINTKPSDAMLYMDGKSIGKSPLLIDGVSQGIHTICVKASGHRDARRIVVITAGKTEEIDIELEPLTGLVLITSVPAGAIIEVNGAEKGKTPLLLTDIPLGKYRIKFVAPGYKTKELDLSVNSRIPIMINTELQSDTAFLTVKSTPAGARLTVNGIDYGTTPQENLKIPSGESEVELKLDGYKPFSRKIKLAVGEKNEISVPLEPIPAILKVVSIPPKARVYLDNQYQGETPLEIGNLKPGNYRVRVEKDGYEVMFRNVTLALAQSVTEEFRLKSFDAILRLTTEPAGVTVYLDGKKIGETKAKSEGTDAVSEPLVFNFESLGEHQLVLTKSKYFKKEYKIKAEQGKTIDIHAILERQFIPDYEVITTKGVYKGVLVEIDAIGNVKLEISPGIFKTIPAIEIKVRRPLKVDIKEEAK